MATAQTFSSTNSLSLFISNNAPMISTRLMQKESHARSDEGRANGKTTAQKKTRTSPWKQLLRGTCVRYGGLLAK